MDGIMTRALTPTRVTDQVLGALAKAVTPTTRTPRLSSTHTTAINTPNPYALANLLPRFAR
jgi:hypothetical protein